MPRLRRSTIRALLIATATFGALLALATAYAWRSSRLAEQSERRYERALSSSAEASLLTLERWFRERRVNASVLAAAIPKLPRDELDEVASRSLRQYGQYDAVWILDAGGAVIGRAGAHALPSDAERAAALAAMREGKPRLVGPERTEDGRAVFSFVAPAIPAAAGATIMRSNVERHLLPLAPLSFPTSPSGQNMIVARDGSDILVITPMRAPRSPPLTLRVAWSAAPEIFRYALTGPDTAGTFIDLRRRPVVAATRRLPATGWGIIRQIDDTEVRAANASQLRAEALAAAALLAILSLGILYTGRRARLSQLRVVEESERQLAGIIGSAMDAIITFDESGTVTVFNRAAERLFGRHAEEVRGGDVDRLIPGFRARVADHKLDTPPEGGGAYVAIGENEGLAGVRANGETFPFDATVSRVRVGGRTLLTVILRDVTEERLHEAKLRASENQLRQAQKMEAVGQLAGGIAHDFNNILTAITGFSELVLSDRGLTSTVRTDVREIRRAAERAAGLTRQLLMFGRRQVVQPALLTLNDVLQDMGAMLERLAGADVRIVHDLEPDLTPVLADPNQIEQVMVNLVVNARDAMKDGGTLTIETANVDRATAPTGATWQEVISGDCCVRLTVRDTGSGMNDETRRRAFEPFFTTKEAGQGTGLGLATVYGIVQQSNGYVEIESELGAGTAVHVFFPEAGSIPARADTDAEALRRAQVARPAASPPPMDTQLALADIFATSAARVDDRLTVLLAEDEDPVRAIARRVLTGAGYRVIEARNGEDALAVASAHEGPIDALVTDVVMPIMGGRELAERLASIRPSTRVLFISGYTGESAKTEFTVSSGAAFLQKPFTAEDMLGKLRDVLGAVAAVEEGGAGQ